MCVNKWKIVLTIVLLTVIAGVGLAQTEFLYDSAGARNPFIALVTPDGRLLRLDSDSTNANVSLEGIIFDEKGASLAIVNGEIIKTGDEIAGYQILRIEKSKVVFIKNGEPLELQIKEEAE